MAKARLSKELQRKKDLRRKKSINIGASLIASGAAQATAKTSPEILQAAAIKQEEARRRRFRTQK